MSTLLDFYGPNAGYVLELYDSYQQDPSSVDPEARALFASGFIPSAEGAATGAARRAAPAAPAASAPALDIAKIVAAARLARIVRELGHLEARLDPLGSTPPGDPALELATHNLTTDDLAALPASVVGGPLAQNSANAWRRWASCGRHTPVR
jgi:2-oxoglutarate dehydrogenase E1 component